MRSLGYYWWALRRELRRGPGATIGEHLVGPKIWRWRNPFATSPLQSVPVVAVLGRDHLVMTAWMLASWTQATGRNWRIVLHDDGTLPGDAAERLRCLGLQVSVVGRTEADAWMEPALNGYSRCAAYRTRHPLGLKIFDVPHLQDAGRFLLLDSDLLFFQRPAEILTWIDDEADNSCWFNRDVSEASNVSRDEASARLTVSLWDRVNSGLCLLVRSAINLDFCERVLAETSILAGHPWRVEQTLFALCAGRHGKGGTLPSVYEVSLAHAASPGCVARHYVGAVRDEFWREGVRRLQKALLAA